MADVSCSLRIALVISLLAFILTVVGMASPYWLDSESTGGVGGYSGLWKMCVKIPVPGSRVITTTCSSYSEIGKMTADAYPGWLKAVQAFEVIGTIVGAVATVAILLCALVEYVGRNKISHVGAMLASFVAAGFVLLGAIVYAAKLSSLVHDANPDVNIAKYLSWAFALCIVGGVGYLAAAVVMICDVRQRWYL